MIAAGIVTYNPDITRLSENISKILPQVAVLYLVDNASINLDEIYTKYQVNNKVCIISNDENKGIAKALNQIIKKCEEDNVEWVITLDQDSVVPNNIIEEFSKYIYKSDVAIITPEIEDRNSSKSKIKQVNSEFEYIDKCITSGALTNISICKEIGYFDEKMFIDLVDFEFCMRVIKSGYKIIRTSNVKLLHQLGDLKMYNFFGIEIYATNHSVLRNYYFARNSIYYQKKHSDKISMYYAYMKMLKKITKNIIFEDKKIDKFKAIIFGILDGNKM